MAAWWIPSRDAFSRKRVDLIRNTKHGTKHGTKQSIAHKSAARAGGLHFDNNQAWFAD